MLMLTKRGPLRQVFTYNARDWGEGDNVTQGGYSDSYVIDHRCGAVLGFIGFLCY